jgi:hypothetical protein
MKNLFNPWRSGRKVVLSLLTTLSGFATLLASPADKASSSEPSSGAQKSASGWTAPESLPRGERTVTKESAGNPGASDQVGRSTSPRSVSEEIQSEIAQVKVRRIEVDRAIQSLQVLMTGPGKPAAESSKRVTRTDPVAVAVGIAEWQSWRVAHTAEIDREISEQQRPLAPTASTICLADAIAAHQEKQRSIDRILANDSISSPSNTPSLQGAATSVPQSPSP